jgi:hypothetical protein
LEVQCLSYRDHIEAIVVPHGSRVVSDEDVNVDIDSDEVRSVDKEEVRDGYGNDNPKMK